MSHPQFSFEIRRKHVLPYVLAQYPPIQDLSPEHYAPLVHQWLWSNLPNPAEESWNIELTSNHLVMTRWYFESYITWDAKEQVFDVSRFDAMWAQQVMDGPSLFPRIADYEWRRVLEKEFTP